MMVLMHALVLEERRSPARLSHCVLLRYLLRMLRVMLLS
jgi:hypothetical protein